MRNDNTILGAPFTFCAYGCPMLYPYIQVFGETIAQLPPNVSKILIEGSKRSSVRYFHDKLTSKVHSIGTDQVYLLALEDAIAHHARGDSYEVLQAMTMLLRSSDTINLERLFDVASKLESERQVGAIIEICNLYSKSRLPEYEFFQPSPELISIPSTFGESESSQTRGEHYKDRMHELEKKWSCRCFLSDEELSKPKSFLEFEAPSFDLLINRTEFYKFMGAMTDFFEEHDIPYLISGGFAITEQVYPCTSPDIDIVIGRNMNEKEVAKLREFATRFDLILTLKDNEIALKKSSKNGVLLGFDISTWIYDKPVDYFSFGRPHKSKSVHLNKSLNFMSLHDLIVLRLGSNRCKAIEDARFASCQSMINWTRIIETLARRGELEIASRDLYLIGGSELRSKAKAKKSKGFSFEPPKLDTSTNKGNKRKNVR